VKRHGFAARAIGILVEDAEAAFTAAVANGAVPVFAPQTLRNDKTPGYCKLSEVKHVADVVMRFFSKHDGYDAPCLPAYEVRKLVSCAGGG
jgi:hypothetical protein